MNVLVMAICGAAAGLGLFVAVAGMRGRAVLPRLVPSAASGPASGAARFVGTDRLLLRLALAIGIGVVAALLTGWVVVVAVGSDGGLAHPHRPRDDGPAPT